MSSRIISNDTIINPLNTSATTPISILENRFSPVNDYIEVHISHNGNVLSSHVGYDRYSLSKEYSDINNSFNSIDVNPISDLEYYGFNSGTYDIQYNIFRKLFSNSLDKSFFIKEISPSRKEVRIGSNDIGNDQIESNFSNLLARNNTVSYIRNIVLTLGNEHISQVINIIVDKSTGSYTLLLKLDDPLDNSINLLDSCWVVESLTPANVYTVELVREFDNDISTKIKGPNFNIGINKDSAYVTEYNTLDDLNSANNANTLSKLLKHTADKNISINVDYTKYKNFVHFSSAEDRLNSFIDKVVSIETIDTKITALNAIGTSFQKDVDIKKLNTEKQSIINNFDGYETFLYFTNDLLAYPKNTANKPFILQPSNSNNVLVWYNSVLLTAQNFDRDSKDYIWYSMPKYITDDVNNGNLKLFVNALGHYYDNIWIYVKSITDIHTATNNINTGISKDLVRDMLVSFGVKLYNDSNESTLEQDVVGNNTGVLGADNLDIISTKEYNQELHKRIYHNLPLLLKSKGTVRSIQTLLSIYGIPSSILSTRTKASSFPSNISYDKIVNINSIAVGQKGHLNTPWNSSLGIHFRVNVNRNYGLLYKQGNLTLTTADTGLHYSMTVANTGTTSMVVNIPKSDGFADVFLTFNSGIAYLYVYSNGIMYNASTPTTQTQWNNLGVGSYGQIGATLTGTSYITFFREYSVYIPIQTAVLLASNPFYIPATNTSNTDLGFKNISTNLFRSTAGTIVEPWRTTITSTYQSSEVKYAPLVAFNLPTNNVVYIKFYNKVGALNTSYTVKDKTKFIVGIDGNSLLYKEHVLEYSTKTIDSIVQTSSVDGGVLSVDNKQITHSDNSTLLDVSVSRGNDLSDAIIDYNHDKNLNEYFANYNDLYSDDYNSLLQLRREYFTNNDVRYNNSDYIMLAKYINTSVFKMIQDFTPVGVDIITGVSIQPSVTDRNKYKYQKNVIEIEGNINADFGKINLEAGPGTDIIIDNPYIGELPGLVVNVDKILSKAGYNKYINQMSPDEQEFIRSMDNALYGNVHNNVKYSINDSSQGEVTCRLYRISNTYPTVKFCKVFFCGSEVFDTVPVPANSSIDVCAKFDPVIDYTWAGENLTYIRLTNEGCNVDATPILNETIELQSYDSNLTGFDASRYSGSKLINAKINDWTLGDDSYAKTAAINSYSSHVGIFSRIYSGSIGKKYNNVTVKYLVDRDGGLTELNELNRNHFDIQNIFEINKTATVSLFDPLEYSNQRNTNGTKEIFNSGYYYKPVFYFNETDTNVKFETNESDMFSRFNASTILGTLSNYYSPDSSIYTPILNISNSYDIYNIYNTIVSNSYNSFKLGNIQERRFPSYTVIDESMKYSFKASLQITTTFPATSQVPVSYSLEIVRSQTSAQNISDEVIAMTTVTAEPGHTLSPLSEPQVTILRNGMSEEPIGVRLYNRAWDDVNAVYIPIGLYRSYSISSEILFPVDHPLFQVYDNRYWIFVIKHNDQHYMTHIRRKGAKTSELDFINYLGYNTAVTRTMKLKTDWMTDLDLGDTIYFRFRKLDSNPVLQELIIPEFTKVSVDVDVSEFSGGLLPAIDSVVSTDTIIFNKSISKYYSFNQLSTNQELITKYGLIEGPFTIKEGDIIHIIHPDSSLPFISTIKSAFVNAEKQIVVVLDTDLPANIIYASNKITELVISSKTKDETNIILSFSKADGETSYGLLIPEDLHPEFLDNIDVITREIKEKLINKNN